jgi:2-methylcitrate dehydratase PrpD
VTGDGSSPTISQRLASWAAGIQLSDLPPEVLDDARWRLIDQVGVCIAGTRSESARAVHRVAERFGGNPQATTLVTGSRYSAPLAGWVNGAVGHAADYDDMNGTAAVHISSVAVPAALSAAEALRASGAQCLLAMVVGAEVGLRILSGAPPHQFHKRGLHGTGVAGPFVAAAITAKLMGLESHAIAQALGMAGSRASGLMQTLVDGSWVKQLHPGWAVEAGLTCAWLASEGFTGPMEVVEGQYGFFRSLLHGDEEQLDLERILADLGRRWLLPETTFKPWPNGVWNHASMEGAQLITHSEGLSIGDIERIDVYVPPVCLPIVCEPREAKLHPQSVYHMKFSLPYSVAMLLKLGRVEVDDYRQDVLEDPEIAALAARVHCHPDPSMQPETFPARVELTTQAGRVLVHDVPAQLGSSQHPMSQVEHRRKFHGNAVPSLGERRTEQLLEALESFSECPEVERITALTVPTFDAVG